MKWVLIALVKVNLGVNIDSVEFNNKAACLYAKNTIISMDKKYNYIRGIQCVPKGE